MTTNGDGIRAGTGPSRPDRMVQDVICLAIPEEINPGVFLNQNNEFTAAFVTILTKMAQEQVWTQWPVTKPTRVDWQVIEWMVTDKISDVQEFQPAHDCEDCRLGNVRAEAFLREHPGRWIAMGNLTYTPRWMRS